MDRKVIIGEYTILHPEYLQAVSDYLESVKHPWAEFWVWQAKTKMMFLREFKELKERGE